MDSDYTAPASYRDFLKVMQKSHCISVQYKVGCELSKAISLHTAFQAFPGGFLSQVTCNYSFVEQKNNCQAEKMNNLGHYLLN